MEHPRSRRLPTLSRPTSPYDSIGQTLSGLSERADKVVEQLAERGPTIEAHLRRLPSEHGTRKLAASTQPPMTVPKLLRRPFTSGPTELVQRSRYFAARLAVLPGSTSVPALQPGLLPRLPSEASLRRPRTEASLRGVQGLRHRAASQSQSQSQSQLARPRGVAATRLDALTDAFLDEFKRAHKQRPACLKIQVAWVRVAWGRVAWGRVARVASGLGFGVWASA